MFYEKSLTEPFRRTENPRVGDVHLCLWQCHLLILKVRGLWEKHSSSLHRSNTACSSTGKAAAVPLDSWHQLCPSSRAAKWHLPKDTGGSEAPYFHIGTWKEGIRARNDAMGHLDLSEKSAQVCVHRAQEKYYRLCSRRVEERSGKINAQIHVTSPVLKHRSEQEYFYLQ